MATYKQLLAEKEALEAKLNEVRATEVASVIDKIRELMTEYGLTAEDLGFGTKAPAGKKAVNRKVPVRYRDSACNTPTW